jgi:hypothetical protein
LEYEKISSVDLGVVLLALKIEKARNDFEGNKGRIQELDWE